jgi:protein-export membrane protein SecD
VGTGLISYPQAVSKVPPVYNVLNKLKINLGLDLQGGSYLEYNADLRQIDKSKVNDAMQGLQDIMEKRVNASGLAESVIYTTKSGNEEHVVVELAGVKDINQAKNIIQDMPFLEFKEQSQANQTQGSGGDLGWVKKGEMVPEFENALFDPSLKDGQVYPQVVESQYGWHIIKRIESKGDGDNLEIHVAHILLAKQANQGDSSQVPQDVMDNMNNQAKAKADDILKKALAGDDFAQLANANSQDPGNKPQAQFVSTGLTGKNLKNADVEFQSQGLSEPVVSLQFDDEGAKLFDEITKRNVGKPVAIFLDGSPISTPKVNEEISSGRAQISGNFTVDEATQLKSRLNEGALPVPIHLVGESTVEATLGQTSLHQSLIAGAIGLGIVMLFMITYYRYLGLVASFALLIYTALMVAIFKFSTLTPWSVTFTLSGIAGFVLSIGMAVDANVLIFERTKEEMRRGRSLRNAINEGFRRAWPSIRDGNFSTMLTSVILIGVGTGFVQGFAIILVIGVLVSMFTAIVLVRIILNFLTGEWAEKRLWIIARIKKIENS